MLPNYDKEKAKGFPLATKFRRSWSPWSVPETEQSGKGTTKAEKEFKV